MYWWMNQKINLLIYRFTVASDKCFLFFMTCRTFWCSNISLEKVFNLSCNIFKFPSTSFILVCLEAKILGRYEVIAGSQYVFDWCRTRKSCTSTTSCGANRICLVHTSHVRFVPSHPIFASISQSVSSIPKYYNVWLLAKWFPQVTFAISFPVFLCEMCRYIIQFGRSVHTHFNHQWNAYNMYLNIGSPALWYPESTSTFTKHQLFLRHAFRNMTEVQSIRW